MSRSLEVRANLSFGRFRQGNVYEISIDDRMMMSLLGVGYLEPTSDLEEDYAGFDQSPGLAVGADNSDAAGGGDGGVESVPASGVEDVADSAEPAGSASLRPAKRSGNRTGVVE